MDFVYRAHSGVRYLVLLAGVVALAYFLFGLVAKRPAGKDVRILGSIYTGVYDLQVLLGLVLLALRLVARFWYPALAGHLVMGVLGAASVHVLMTRNRKLAQPGFLLPLLAVVLSLLFAVGGIYAIGRTAFGSVPMPVQ
jgi:hypothetical protein